MARTALAVLSALVGMVVVFTILTGGRFSLGTSPTGPSFSFGFAGPQAR
jgi:hypothetical protein